MAKKPAGARGRTKATKARKRNPGRKRPIGCLVWAVLMVAIAIAFFAARASIARAVEGSGIGELVGLPDRRPKEQPTASTAAPADPAAAPEATAPSPAPTPSPGERPAPPAAQRTTPSPTPRPVQPSKPMQTPGRTAPPPSAAPARQPAATPKATPAPQRRRSTLYFVTISDEGAISFAGIPRSVSYVDAPLTQTLEALVAGPTPGERERGYRSLIPAGTRLEEVRVEGRTAFVSFSESFRFSAFGREGLVGQLRQVVYTATEFGTVDRVQILIGGKVAEYLGQEGVRIREPLSRESFSNGRL